MSKVNPYQGLTFIYRSMYLYTLHHQCRIGHYGFLHLIVTHFTNKENQLGWSNVLI